MAVNASTPIELIEGVYSTLADRVAGGREHFNRGLTLAEKKNAHKPSRSKRPRTD